MECGQAKPIEVASAIYVRDLTSPRPASPPELHQLGSCLCTAPNKAIVSKTTQTRTELRMSLELSNLYYGYILVFQCKRMARANPSSLVASISGFAPFLRLRCKDSDVSP